MQSLTQIVDFADPPQGRSTPSSTKKPGSFHKASTERHYGFNHIGTENTPRATSKPPKSGTELFYGTQSKSTPHSSCLPVKNYSVSRRSPSKKSLSSPKSLSSQKSPSTFSMFGVGWARAKERARREGTDAAKLKQPGAGMFLDPDPRGAWNDPYIDSSIDPALDWENKGRRSKLSKLSKRKSTKSGASKTEATEDGKTPECDRKMTFDKMLPQDKMGKLEEESEDDGPKKRRSSHAAGLFRKIKGMLKKERKAE